MQIRKSGGNVYRAAGVVAPNLCPGELQDAGAEQWYASFARLVSGDQGIPSQPCRETEGPAISSQNSGKF